jgi:hypothetical protein
MARVPAVTMVKANRDTCFLQGYSERLPSRLRFEFFEVRWRPTGL